MTGTDAPAMPATPPNTGVGADLGRARRQAALICGAAVVLLVLVSLLPPFTLFDRLGELLSVHLLLETFSVVVSVMVVSMAWHTINRAEADMARVLIFGFTVVAGADLVHALSYAGMPSLLTPSSTPKAIFFWFVGRSFEVLTVWLVASRVRLVGSRLHWLGLGLLNLVVWFWLGTYHLDWFPETFRPGEGVTRFKAAYEYALCAGNLGAAAWLFWQSRTEHRPRNLWLGTACFVMGVGELAFTSYLTPSDFLNLFGHVFKVVAFAFVYRAIFLAGLQEPYERLERSERRVRAQQSELQNLLRNLPAGISRIDPQMRYRYVNDEQLGNLGVPVEQIVGQRVEDVLGPEIMAQVRPHMERAFSGMRCDYELTFTNRSGRLVDASVVVVPERDAQGELDGVLTIVTDNTERNRTHRALLDSLREISDLKAALDAHAIVAVTDARGVIQRVNDKFCAISQYPRSELVGKTHRIINSGTHPKGFFADMWRTISRGEVWNGEVCNRAKDGSLYWVYTTIVPFIGADGLPEQYIAIRADITERKRAEEEAQRMVYFDTLTGLPNRRLLTERLLQGIAHAGHQNLVGALVLIDLDNFKEVNDTLGHDLGDELLRLVAQRLLGSVRQGDTVARLGGDEFALVLGELGPDLAIGTAAAADLGEKVRRLIEQPLLLNGLRADVAMSAGVVMLRGHGERVDEILKQADMALYKAKGAGGNQLCFFDPGLQADVNRRASLLADMRRALENDELRLFYQPVVNAQAKVVGHEGLLRWQHPTRGLVSPGEFIPLAENSGLILPMGQWVLERACEQLARWSQNPATRDWSLAINVSARQFHLPEFVQEVLDALQRYGADPHRLRLELTESMLQDDLNETIDRMAALQQRGVRFSLDDFGTGYSSLSYLKRLPLDLLKIDKSFVSDVTTDANDAAIAQTIVALAASLELGVVAEGVETPAQFNLLKSLGCGGYQGYLFGRPVPIEAIAEAARTAG